MDMSIPDRPRRLVTYGKLARNQTERKQRAQAQEQKHSNGLTVKQSRVANSEKGSLRQSVEDAEADGRGLVESHDSVSPSQRARLSNRSPKRRKLSPKGDDEVSLISSPRRRTWRGAARQTTYGRSKWTGVRVNL